MNHPGVLDQGKSLQVQGAGPGGLTLAALSGSEEPPGAAAELLSSLKDPQTSS